MESLANTTEQYQAMPDNVQDSAMMIYYRKCLSNLEKFNGGEEQKVSQFINNIERIGRMIEAKNDILHCTVCDKSLSEIFVFELFFHICFSNFSFTLKNSDLIQMVV